MDAAAPVMGSQVQLSVLKHVHTGFVVRKVLWKPLIMASRVALLPNMVQIRLLLVPMGHEVDLHTLPVLQRS